ncbi:hypothetical protein ACFYNL_27895 [Streptomyces sp. NPDC007808]|uniref:hypothetical protein n=1 Tax=Streptomyces sp. NPDC007808 TaxID=3364779 RepID=UPI0036CDA90B
MDLNDGRGRRVTVVWADAGAGRHVRVRVPSGVVYDIMGRRIGERAAVSASPDPVYVVSRAAGPAVAAEPTGRGRRVPRPLSAAEHIVLSQRYAARNAAPGKDDGDAPPPYGYRLGRRTRMSVDVYNFGASGRQVSVAAEAMGAGWSVGAVGGTRVWVPAGGRVGVEFVIVAGRSVPRRTDRRPAFGARLDDGSEVPGSVALVHLR